MRSFFVTCILSESEWGKLTKSAIMILKWDDVDVGNDVEINYVDG